MPSNSVIPSLRMYPMSTARQVCQYTPIKLYCSLEYTKIGKGLKSPVPCWLSAKSQPQLPQGAHIFGTQPPGATVWHSFLLFQTSLPRLLPAGDNSLLLKGSCDYIGPTWIISRLPHSVTNSCIISLNSGIPLHTQKGGDYTRQGSLGVILRTIPWPLRENNVLKSFFLIQEQLLLMPNIAKRSWGA